MHSIVYTRGKLVVANGDDCYDGTHSGPPGNGERFRAFKRIYSSRVISKRFRFVK